MSRDAQRKAKALGSIKNSITKGGGNIAGYLAELALARHLNAENISCDEGEDKFDYDLIKDGLKIDAKAKRRTVDPRANYEVSIAKTSKHQQPDVYAFVSITFKEKRGKGKRATYHGIDSIWLCGFMLRDEYFEKATFLRKGDIDPSNNFKVHADMYNLPISSLYKEWGDLIFSR